MSYLPDSFHKFPNLFQFGVGFQILFFNTIRQREPGISIKTHQGLIWSFCPVAGAGAVHSGG